MPHRVGLRLLVAVLAVGAPMVRPETHHAAVRDDVVVVRGEILRDTVFKRKRTYLLQGIVRIRSGATLVVRPGVTVFCDQGSGLVVDQGARIEAVGTAERPIVFTSAQLPAERRRGDWRGIVVNGRAPVSASGGTATGDDGSGTYGGYETDDDSGAIGHARIEYAGYPDGPESRAAGLSLRAVGEGTTIDGVEALNGDGDGIVVLGGTVGIRHVASVGNARTGFRFSTGWTGNAQFLLAAQRGDVVASSYAGIAADACTPHVANVTVVGGTTGLRFGDGTRGSFADVMVIGCTGVGLAARASSVSADILRGALSLPSVLASGNAAANAETALRDALAMRGDALDERDARLRNAYDEAAPDFRPVDGSPALERSAPRAAGPYFEPAAYGGGFGAGEAADWTFPWAHFELPPVPRRLANSAESSEALARMFLMSLAANDVVSMKRLRVTKNEFCWYVWPELPASRLPNVTCDFVWSQATLNSLAGLAEVLHDYGGRRFELVSLRFAGDTDRYAGYTVHGDTRVTVRDEAGDEYELKLFGSMLELDGRFKLFSFVVD